MSSLHLFLKAFCWNSKSLVGLDDFPNISLVTYRNLHRNQVAKALHRFCCKIKKRWSFQYIKQSKNGLVNFPNKPHLAISSHAPGFSLQLDFFIDWNGTSRCLSKRNVTQLLQDGESLRFGGLYPDFWQDREAKKSCFVASISSNLQLSGTTQVLLSSWRFADLLGVSTYFWNLQEWYERDDYPNWNWQSNPQSAQRGLSKPDVWHNDALVWHMVLKDTDAVLSKVSQCPHTGRDSSSERCIWRRPNWPTKDMFFVCMEAMLITCEIVCKAMYVVCSYIASMFRISVYICWISLQYARILWW